MFGDSVYAICVSPKSQNARPSDKGGNITLGCKVSDRSRFASLCGRGRHDAAGCATVRDSGRGDGAWWPRRWPRRWAAPESGSPGRACASHIAAGCRPFPVCGPPTRALSGRDGGGRQTARWKTRPGPATRRHGLAERRNTHWCVPRVEHEIGPSLTRGAPRTRSTDAQLAALKRSGES